MDVYYDNGADGAGHLVGGSLLAFDGTLGVTKTDVSATTSETVTPDTIWQDDPNQPFFQNVISYCVRNNEMFIVDRPTDPQGEAHTRLSVLDVSDEPNTPAPTPVVVPFVRASN